MLIRNIKKNTGLTVIEVVVVMVIISVLILLIIPAVQMARESARRTACTNNLRQISIGIQSYLSINKCYAPSIMSTKKGSTQVTFYSPHVRMLPYIEQTALYNSINFQQNDRPLDNANSNLRSLKSKEHDKTNETVYQTHLSIFICPSDTVGAFANANSYRGNTGVGPTGASSAERPDSGNGIFPESGIITESMIIDGTNSTAAFSERLLGTGIGHQGTSPARDIYISNSTRVHTSDESLTTCEIFSRKDAKYVYTYAGSQLFWTGRERTLYNHTQTPNGKVADCFHGNVITAIGMATARSTHKNGVNVLMADGSSRFITQSISQTTWRALGTRNGGELVE